MKKRFKENLKKNWKVWLASGLFLLFGLIALIVGFTISGFSFIAWLKSPYATTFFIIIIIGVIILLLLLLEMKRRKLGE